MKLFRKGGEGVGPWVAGLWNGWGMEKGDGCLERREAWYMSFVYSCALFGSADV